jgi:hypothetical protein
MPWRWIPTSEFANRLCCHFCLFQPSVHLDLSDHEASTSRLPAAKRSALGQADVN